MVTQLLLILDEWTEALELGGRVDVIYIYIYTVSQQEAQQLLGMADHTGPVVKLSYLRELVWQPSWELDNCPDWLS